MADSFLVQAWYRKSPWLWVLRPLELVFRAIAFLRRLGFRSGLFKVFRSDVPVVVVGNITVGGTGKTPVVIALVEALQARGLRPGVVSRGYGGRAEAYPFTVSAHSDPGACGDEPLLIHRRTGCPVVVDPDRVAALRQLVAEGDIDVVISDDGLQHYALARDMEIVLLDGERGLGNGWCLPAGPLREPAARLASTDWLLERGGSKPEGSFRYAPGQLRRLVDGEARSPEQPGFGPEVRAIAGIGQPAQFFETLETLGFRVRKHPFPDHHAYRPGDFIGLDDLPIIMTEKDAVKCGTLAGQDAWYLAVDAILPEPLLDAAARLAQRSGSSAARP